MLKRWTAHPILAQYTHILLIGSQQATYTEDMIKQRVDDTITCFAAGFAVAGKTFWLACKDGRDKTVFSA